MASQLLGVTDYVVIGLMLAVSASVGLYFRFTGGRQKTTDEFLMGGKSMGVFPVAFSLMATYMSAISVLGVPAETYMYSTQIIMWMVGVPIGGVVSCYGILPVFYELQITTAYEYLEKRFGRTTRTVAALLFALQMIFYMAVVLYAPSLALNAVTGLSTWASVISLAVVCTFYCSLGGLKAVLWTDVFQSMLMYTCIIAVVVVAFVRIGASEVFRIADEGGRLVFFNTSTDLTERYTFWNGLVGGIIFSFHTFGTNQAQVQRMLSVGHLGRAQKALLISIPLILIFNFFCTFDGVAIYSIFHDCDPMMDDSNSIDSPDQLMPYYILKTLGHIPGLPGLCIAGVFSASLSTVSSAVNSLTAVTMEDFIRPFCFCKSLTEKWAAFMAKILAIGFGAICLVLTIIVANFRGVLEASNVLFGMIGGPIMGLYFLGMFTSTANETGTLFGLLVGFTLNAWIGFGSYASKPYVPNLVRSTDGCQNETIRYNGTESFETSTLEATENPFQHNEDMLWIYTVSFIWFPLIGCLSVIFIGYIASYIAKCFVTHKDVCPESISPFVRKCIFKQTDEHETNGIYKQNQVELDSYIKAEASHHNNGFVKDSATTT